MLENHLTSAFSKHFEIAYLALVSKPIAYFEKLLDVNLVCFDPNKILQEVEMRQSLMPLITTNVSNVSLCGSKNLMTPICTQTTLHCTNY